MASANSVVVAAGHIERGTVLTESLVRVAEMPSAFAPPGALRSIEQAVGQTAATDLAEGEAVTSTRVGGGEAGPVASLVPSGLRAFPVEAGVPPGSVRPGDRVDVFATFGGPNPHTETVAQGLEVLLVLDKDEADGTSLTTTGSIPSLILLVSPDVAERLAFATAFADLAIAIAPVETG